MITRYSMGVLAAMTLLGLAGGAQGANVLVNPGFEAGSLTSWEGLNVGTVPDYVITGSTAPEAGSFLAKGTDVPVPYTEALIQRFAPSARTIYEASFWYRTGDTGTAFPAWIVAEFYNGTTRSRTYEPLALINDGAWHKATTVSLGNMSQLAGFGVIAQNLNGSLTRPGVDFDEFMLSDTPVTVPEAGTLGMLGMGVVGVLARRRGK